MLIILIYHYQHTQLVLLDRIFQCLDKDKSIMEFILLHNQYQ